MKHKLDAREYKILLNPQKFMAPLSLAIANDFWEGVLAPIIETCLGDRTVRSGFDKVIERKVRFWDTDDCALTSADLALRSRLEVRDGAPADEHEVTLKLRMTDFFVVADTQFGQSTNGEKPELEEDIAPLEVQLPTASGGIVLPQKPSSRSRYSLTTKRRVDWEASPTETFLKQLFPAVTDLVQRPLRDGRLRCGPEVHEYAAKGAEVVFSQDTEGKFTLTLWYFQSEEETTVVEFSFKCDTPNGEMSGKTAKRALGIFTKLQADLGDYLNSQHSSKTVLALPVGCHDERPPLPLRQHK
jgi:hypothetical protein|nr:hypothetical protein [Neorhizobium tomejilense]